MTPIFIVALTAGAFLIALFVTRLLAGLRAAIEGEGRAKRRARHHAPAMPSQPGLGLLAGALPAWGVLFDQGGAGRWTLPLAVGIAALAIVSWWHERAGLPWAVRRLVEAAAVAIAASALVFLFNFTISATPNSSSVSALAYAAAAFAGVLWFGLIGAVGQADRAGGLAAIDILLIAAGAALAFWWLGSPIRGTLFEVAFAATLAAASAGFLVWHRPPAPAVMGRIASAPIGFMLGFLLVVLAALGAWGAALTLPARVGADALLSVVSGRRGGIGGSVRNPWHVAAVDAALVGAVAAGLAVGGLWGQALTILLGALVLGVFFARAPHGPQPAAIPEAQRGAIAPDRRAR